jgi:UDPglucose 6-dehydrogenase
MRITVVGSGYVGLVTGACLAEVGNSVICVDADIDKVESLNKGIIPIWEPGLEKLVLKNHAEGRLSFTTDIKTAVEASVVLFIAVGTPPGEDGSADMQYVLAVAKDIANYMNGYKIIVDKSTVPVGTADRVHQLIMETQRERGSDYKFCIVSNPEFLKEGAAISDFMKPDRIVIGVEDQEAESIMRELYSPFSVVSDKIITMSVRSAEMTKYAANAMLATKISFINEIAMISEEYGADISEVRLGIGSDTRIGYSFIYPGVGYGGSCFPKDVKALVHMARQAGIDPRVLNAVETRNNEQKTILAKKIIARFGQDLSGLKFAVWGLSFKPETDDMREAPSIVIINQLVKLGASISAYDPVAINEARHILGDNQNVVYFEDQYDACKNADALILVTEWRQFRSPDFLKLKDIMQHHVVFDGRNQYDPDKLREEGFDYYGIGR